MKYIIIGAALVLAISAVGCRRLLPGSTDPSVPTAFHSATPSSPEEAQEFEALEDVNQMILDQVNGDATGIASAGPEKAILMPDGGYHLGTVGATPVSAQDIGEIVQTATSIFVYDTNGDLIQEFAK